MQFTRARTKEASDLRAAILVSLLLTAYTIALYLVDAVRDYFAPFSRITLLEALSYILVFWLLLVLWVAYRRWRQVTITDRELEDIITGINPDVFLVVSPERRIAMCNRTVEQMFGFAPDELIDQSTELLYYDRRSPGHGDDEIYQHLERLGFHVGLATGKRRDGESFPLEIITGTLRGRRGAVLLVRDITRRVQAEDAFREKAQLLAQLEEKMARLSESEDARENLLQIIVHDMKSPLHVIMGNMELLKLALDGKLSDSANPKSCVQETLAHTRRLVEMVNSLLDVSRLESGELPLDLSTYDLRLAARRAIAGMGPLLSGRDVGLEAPDQALNVHCDPAIIQRILVNLLTNAVVHTPKETKVTVSIRGYDGQARVEVQDNGPGIPADYHEKVFEKFAQVPADRKTKRRGSSGIGLTFCKLAVEAQGGRIGLESREKEGCTFWFELPLQPSTPSP